jgi:glycosyltransferase involved in cell wall biosynthesis
VSPRKPLSVIVPVYNEAGLLEKAIKSMYDYLVAEMGEFEIIVIESGSTDQSARIADRMAESIPRMTVIHEGRRNGFGSAVRLGYQKATYDYALVLTLDMPFPIETIGRAMDLTDRAECVLSYRINDRRKIGRRFQSFVYNTLVKTALGLRVKHVNSAFKLIKKSLLKGVELRSSGWFIDAEVLYWIQKKKASFVQIPVELIDRSEGRSSVGTFAFWGILKEMQSFLAKRE